MQTWKLLCVKAFLKTVLVYICERVLCYWLKAKLVTNIFLPICLRRSAFKLQICSSVILARGVQYFNDVRSYAGIEPFFSVWLRWQCKIPRFSVIAKLISLTSWIKTLWVGSYLLFLYEKWGRAVKCTICSQTVSAGRELLITCPLSLQFQAGITPLTQNELLLL